MSGEGWVDVDATRTSSSTPSTDDTPSSDEVIISCQVYCFLPDASQCLLHVPLSTTAAELKGTLIAEREADADILLVCTRNQADLSEEDPYPVPREPIDESASLKAGGAQYDDIRGKWLTEITAVRPREALRRSAGAWTSTPATAGWAFLSVPGCRDVVALFGSDQS